MLRTVQDFQLSKPTQPPSAVGVNTLQFKGRPLPQTVLLTAYIAGQYQLSDQTYFVVLGHCTHARYDDGSDDYPDLPALPLWTRKPYVEGIGEAEVYAFSKDGTLLGRTVIRAQWHVPPPAQVPTLRIDYKPAFDSIEGIGVDKSKLHLAMYRGAVIHISPVSIANLPARAWTFLTRTILAGFFNTGQTYTPRTHTYIYPNRVGRVFVRRKWFASMTRLRALKKRQDTADTLWPNNR